MSEPVKLLFKETIPFMMQMQNLTNLRSMNPDLAREIFMNGQELIELSANGELRKLRKKVLEIHDESLFIIENGFSVTNKSYPSALHEFLETESVEDYLAAGVVSFLVAQGCDVNRQISGTWLTPLHIAVRRNLVETVAALISLGADVNAVAKNDIMPLKIALEQQTSIEDSEKVATITKLLQDHGAKASVKEMLRGSSKADISGDSESSANNRNTFSTVATPHTSTSMISVTSGGSANRPNATAVIDEGLGKSSLTVAPSTTTSAIKPVATTSGNFVRFAAGSMPQAPLIDDIADAKTPKFASQFVRFSGGEIPPGNPAVATYPEKGFAKFSSSTQLLNAISVPVDASSEVAIVIPEVADQVGARDPRNMDHSTKKDEVSLDASDSEPYTGVGDDGGLLFSTCSS